mmetsp:Transcript_70700/g.202556  ORF Transcript_70700/g.202556 Transcript_70700/m.202556 type:complete len:238 (-) Transcript_70700:185-898(-)
MMRLSEVRMVEGHLLAAAHSSMRYLLNEHIFYCITAQRLRCGALLHRTGCCNFCCNLCNCTSPCTFWCQDRAWAGTPCRMLQLLLLLLLLLMPLLLLVLLGLGRSCFLESTRKDVTQFIICRPCIDAVLEPTGCSSKRLFAAVCCVIQLGFGFYHARLRLQERKVQRDAGNRSATGRVGPDNPRVLGLDCTQSHIRINLQWMGLTGRLSTLHTDVPERLSCDGDFGAGDGCRCERGT